MSLSVCGEACAKSQVESFSHPLGLQLNAFFFACHNLQLLQGISDSFFCITINKT
jgi:hypothetical protein